MAIQFIIFGAILICIALFHTRTFEISTLGLLVLVLYKSIFDDKFMLMHHLSVEWVILTNLFLLLVGFAVLADYFERSGISDKLPKYLPTGWKGPFVLLVLVFIFSGFLDNIASAIIGGSIAAIIFRNKVHPAYLVSIVAASNAGGAYSVLGDTTTTLMWLDGISPLVPLRCFIGAVVSFLVFAVVSSVKQQKFQPVIKDSIESDYKISWSKIILVVFILFCAVVTNVSVNVFSKELGDKVPAFGMALWFAIIIGSFFVKTDWTIIPKVTKGSLFLVALVLCASLMPVSELPKATWQTTLGLGFLSSIFDNIPLTKLALEQGGYDWAFLAYAVGFGGSIFWFGSSAGVAICNRFTEAKSVKTWFLSAGWYVAIAYVVGYIAMLLTLGWNAI